jgi:hypothetical protein
VATGVDAWLPEPMPPAPKRVEYRMQVRPTSLSVTVLDPDTRTPLLPSQLLAFQAQAPTGDRDALRMLARLENEGPRRVGIEIRGEDAAELLPYLKGRRVILEPQMMELRFGDEPLRPRFDLELSQDGTQVLVKSSFQRPGPWYLRLWMVKTVLISGSWCIQTGIIPVCQSWQCSTSGFQTFQANSAVALAKKVKRQSSSSPP